MHSNPFIKKKVLDSSERMRLKVSKTLIKGVNSNIDSQKKTNNYSIENNEITKVISHEMLLSLTKGYYEINNKHCSTIRDYVNSVSEGLYSYQNLNDEEPSCGCSKKCGCSKQRCCVKYVNSRISKQQLCNESKPIYVVDKCRVIKGLITPTAKILPSQRDSLLKFPSKIKKQNTTTTLLYERVFTSGLQDWFEKKYINGYIGFISTSSEDDLCITITGKDMKKKNIRETIFGPFNTLKKSENEYDCVQDISTNLVSNGTISVFSIPTCNYKSFIENTIPIDIHSDMSKNHCHIYRGNNKLYYYKHNHDSKPHPDPKPFPNQDVTNQYSYFHNDYTNDYNLIDVGKTSSGSSHSSSNRVCLKCARFKCICKKS